MPMLKSPLSTPPAPLFPPRGKTREQKKNRKGNKTNKKKQKTEGWGAPCEAPIIT